VSREISLLITDLDNTLFDWFEIWYRPFTAMLDRLVVESGLGRDFLEKEFQEVHRRHGTSEYAFAIEELPSLIAMHPGQDLTIVHGAAIDAYRESRRKVMQLFPTVEESLRALRSRGCLIVAYTESTEFYTKYRIKNLGLDPLIDYLYSPPDHRLPAHLSFKRFRYYSEDHYRFDHTVQRYTPPGELKPNPRILAEIIDDVGGQKEKSLYVGDSLIKDVAMAKSAGVVDVWAKYGVAQNREAYELLRRVTHWRDADVAREKSITEADLKPTVVLRHSFDELLGKFDFGGFSGKIRQ
jgi:HAD superfamily hydrolase (TIGR01549 family)